MTQYEDTLATAVQNVVSMSVVAMTFRWTALIPPPERMVEWVLGAAVAVSILTYNIIRIAQAIKKKKTDE